MSYLITSCGCITLKKTSIRAIPVGETRKLIMKYDSGKNIGYVKHYITLYANFASGEIEEVVFGDETNRGYYLDEDF
ncbi:MAG TPA: DUF1573 domain-containing protein [Sedimentibacter sp.]|nr:DUF1573 domain-containing protein [Sedimentibacter sp.]